MARRILRPENADQLMAVRQLGTLELPTFDLWLALGIPLSNTECVFVLTRQIANYLIPLPEPKIPKARR